MAQTYRRDANDDNDFDEDGILKDGHRLRVPLSMMDSVDDPLQRAVMRDTVERQRARRFGLKDAADLTCPGFRFQTDAAGRDARARAYQDYENSQGEAWRAPPVGQGSHGPRGAQAGDSCMIDGRAGHLREIDGELICVPDGSVSGHDHAMSDREAAHAEHRHYLENAWRNPDRCVQVPVRGPVRGNDSAMTDEREAAYAEYQSRIENAWREGR